jgi:hypothetical protein
MNYLTSSSKSVRYASFEPRGRSRRPRGDFSSAEVLAELNRRDCLSEGGSPKSVTLIGSVKSAL